MNYPSLEAMLKDIYANFGKPPPPLEYRDAIFAKCRHIPDVACPWIAARLGDADGAPRNCGREINAAYVAWLQKNPQHAEKISSCPQCTQGWIDAWTQSGTHNGKLWRHFVSPCPSCRPGESAKTRQQLEREGAVLMPVGYKGGVLRFDHDNGFGAKSQQENGRRGESENYARYAKLVARALRVDMRVDARRLSAMSDDERADAAAAAAAPNAPNALAAVGW